MNFFDSQLNDTLVHPGSFLQFLDKHLFDIGDDLITEILGFLRERFFHEEATEDPAESVIDVTYTGPPALWYGVRVLLGVRMLQLDGDRRSILCLGVRWKISSMA